MPKSLEKTLKVQKLWECLWKLQSPIKMIVWMSYNYSGYHLSCYLVPFRLMQRHI